MLINRKFLYAVLAIIGFHTFINQGQSRVSGADGPSGKGGLGYVNMTKMIRNDIR
jgi:hypothetical protein